MDSSPAGGEIVVVVLCTVVSASVQDRTTIHVFCDANIKFYTESLLFAFFPLILVVLGIFSVLYTTVKIKNKFQFN